MVGLCSWMLIITRGQAGGFEGRMPPSQDVVSGSPLSGFSAEGLTPPTARLPGSRIVISVIVMSSATPQGRVNRQLFRDTTLKLFPSPRNQAATVQYRFVIGHPPESAMADIQREHDLMDDLLMVEDAPDTPDGKSLKLYKAIQWADSQDFDYLVKTEDDVLVRMDILSGELFKLGPRSWFWKGLVFKNVPNTRLDDMDLKEMPKFTDGTLTTLSRDIIRLLAQPAPRYMLASSAQSLGIWLHGYGINPIHDIRIQPGAFVCEENLIAKHFDNEPSVMRQPHEDPRTMVDRINKIRSELKANKNNPSFETQLTICDERIQRRCALCYRCTKRAANWKHMGFDCKPGGVVVGDKYRKPEMLDAKQMDELLNRPSTGISDELEIIPLRDSRPEARYRQQQLQREEEQRQRELELEQLKQLDAAGEGEVEDEDDGGASSVEDDTLQSTEGGSEAGGDEEPVVDDSAAEKGINDEDQGDQAIGNEDEGTDQGSEEDGDNRADGSESTEDQDSHDESEMHISDKEVDYLDRRQDNGVNDAVPPVVKKSLSGSKSSTKKKTGRS
ncbi:hypothetical protein EMPS_00428 [Entomortierella parvispora]|uniref:Hexosyltransferase n=1 Tax=Entomortierella parvispora TaxID=205924 RepID=A0A9P3H142_9FUNG|nr:hypothetical protein EMPS_00428 [Entomortierella parvispora]